MFKSSSNIIRQASQRTASRLVVTAHSGRQLSTSTVRLAEHVEGQEETRQSRMQALLLEIPPEFKIQGMGEFSGPGFSSLRVSELVNFQLPRIHVKYTSREVIDHQNVLATHRRHPEVSGSLPYKLQTHMQLYRAYRSPQSLLARTMPTEGRMETARRGSHEKEMVSDRRGGHRAGHERVARRTVNRDKPTGKPAFELNRHEALRGRVHLEVMDRIRRPPSDHLSRVNRSLNLLFEQPQQRMNCLVNRPCLTDKATLEARYSRIWTSRRKRRRARVSQSE